MNYSDQCTPPDPHSVLQKIWAVMSSDASVMQVDRQTILFETFLSTVGDTVNIADLDILSNILVFLMKHEEFNKVYNDFLHKIINILKNPPTMKKTSDELDFKHCLVKMFSTLGCLLLQNRHEEFKCEILEIVQRMIKIVRPKSSNWIRIKACIDAIELSELVVCLGEFIVISSEDTYQWTVYTILQICEISKFSCWTLLMQNGLDSLLVRLPTAPKHVLDINIQLLWSLFFCTSHPDDWARVVPPSKVALQRLQYVLREIGLIQSLPSYNNTSLNSIAAILLKLMHVFPVAAYYQSGLLGDIAFHATMSETCLESTLKPKFKSLHEQFQFRKLMLACVSLSPTSPLSIDILERYKVVECTVAMLSEGDPSSSPDSWYSEQIELIHCVIQVVYALLESFKKQFINSGIIRKLLILIEIYYINKEPPLEDLTQSVIDVLLSFCCCKVEAELTRQVLLEEGALQILLKVSERILKPVTPLTVRSQSILSKSLIILSSLMENKTELPNIHADQSFFIVSSLYQRVLKPLPTDSLIDNRLIVALLNYVWEVLVWNPDNILKLISSGGIFSNMDLLERSSFPVQLMCLSVLADICQYHQSVPYLVTWRGSGGMKLLSLLCKIWRQDDDSLGVPRSKDGCIIDLERPLMGEEQFVLSKTEKSKLVSTCDIYANTRPKIYAIVQLLHRHREVTEMCEKHYRLGHDELPRSDNVTMQLVKAYLPLKMGEIWYEISSKQETVMPLDRYLTQILSDRWSYNSLPITSQ